MIANLAIESIRDDLASTLPVIQWLATGYLLALAVVTVPFLFFSALPTTVLIIVLVARGVGLALAQMPAYTAAYASVTNKQIGDAATLVNIVQRIGGAVGAIGLVITLAQFGGRTSTAAYTWAFGILTGISLLSMVTGLKLKQSRENRSVAQFS